jgi:hypothetical protein
MSQKLNFNSKIDVTEKENKELIDRLVILEEIKRKLNDKISELHVIKLLENKRKLIEKYGTPVDKSNYDTVDIFYMPYTPILYSNDLHTT